MLLDEAQVGYYFILDSEQRCCGDIMAFAHGDTGPTAYVNIDTTMSDARRNLMALVRRAILAWPMLPPETCSHVGASPRERTGIAFSLLQLVWKPRISPLCAGLRPCRGS